jgi:hypothetical protein
MELNDITRIGSRPPLGRLPTNTRNVQMLKTLLVTSSLSLALVLLPLGSFGPVTVFGTAGLSSADAAQKQKAAPKPEEEGDDECVEDGPEDGADDGADDEGPDDGTEGPDDGGADEEDDDC